MEKKKMFWATVLSVFVVVILVSSTTANPLLKIVGFKTFKEGTNNITYDNMFYFNKRYAVIIVGYYGDEQHYRWFTNDAQRQYNVLTEKYGFNDSEIYVLVTLKEEWIDNLSMNPSIIDHDASEENIIMIFNYLKSIINKNDLLYIVVIDHGNDDHHIDFWKLKIHIDFLQGFFAHDTYFVLEKTSIDNKKELNTKNLDKCRGRMIIDNKVYDYELYNYTKDINARRIVFVLQPCLSGGFINDLSNKNHVVITASREVQLAYAPFIGYFTSGLDGSANDSNEDGRLSLGEIYEYTANMVYQWIEDNPDGNKGQLQHPLIDDNADKVGNRYGIKFGYDPNKKYKDGYVSARIYNLSYEDANLNNWNTHVIDTSNTVNGKPVIYWKNQIGGTIPTGAGKIILANCSNVVVENQNTSGGDAGIKLGFSSSCTILGNNISNTEYGIYLDYSSDNNIICNNISHNWYGIYLSGPSFNNFICHNNLIDNSYNAIDKGNNIWDDGKKGNYWSDYEEKYPKAKKKPQKGVWDTPYEIPGGDNKDYFPLIKPFNKSRNRTENIPFQNFIQSHPNMFPILRYFLGL